MKKHARFLLGLMVIAVGMTHAQSIVEVIRLPNTTYWNQAWGLAPGSGQTRLYATSGTSSTVYNRGFIYALDSTGTLVDSTATGLSTSQGLAWDGSHFWYIRGSGSTGRIYKITPAGVIVDSIVPPSTSWFLGGACWDGSGLWVSLYSPNADAGLYKYNVTTKTLVDTIRTIGQQPQGIAWDGQYLYYAMDLNSTEPNLNLIYVVNPVTRDTVRTIPMPEPPNVDSNPRGLAWDGRFLWLVAEPVGATSGRALYKYDLSGTGTPDIDMQGLVDFGGCRIGVQKTLNVAISNVGTAPLRIDSVRVAISARFSVQLTPPATIQPGTALQIPIHYTATALGPDSASISFFSNDPDESPKLLAARAYGQFGGPTLNHPAAYGFGSRRVQSSSSWQVTLENQGAEQLMISSLTLSNPAFRLDSVPLPLRIDSLSSATLRVWFSPGTASSFTDSLRIASNAVNGTNRTIALSGSGDATPVPLGQPFWTFTVPNNPRTSSNAKLMKGLRAISDINGDGKPDVVVSSENYWTMALNANASGSNDTLWSFNTYISNSSAGSLGSTGDYSHQKAMAVADLNQDGYKDVVIGTGGGNERVYALNGRTGQILWHFGTDHPDSFSLGDITGVDASMDFTGDGVVDVLAAASATNTGGIGGRRSAYLFNGATGAIRWSAPLPGFTHAITAIGDISGDGIADVIGTVGESAYKATAFSGANGALLWDFSFTSATGGGKEVLAWPVAGQTPDVIISAFWGPVYRVDGESGTQVWSCPTGGRSPMQLIRLRDITGDGVDEIVAPLLVGGVYCINGANGTVVWSLPTGNTMGAVVVPDLNGDGFDEVALAVQNDGTLIVKGQDGSQLALYSTGTAQSREVALVPDIDGNGSYEILMGGREGNVALLSGGNQVTSVGMNTPEIPERFDLAQNYPNPFNPSTTIRIGLPETRDFSLRIFDLLGREVRSYEFEQVPAGTHTIVWDGLNARGRQVASGVYYYQFRTKGVTLTKQMLLVR